MSQDKLAMLEEEKPPALPKRPGIDDSLSPIAHAPSSSTSTPPPPLPAPFASISFALTDSLRLLNFPAPLTHALTSTVIAHWPAGIARSTVFHGARELRLHGQPWAATLDADAVAARRLVAALLATLTDAGWALALGSMLTQRASWKHALVFRAPAATTTPPPHAGLAPAAVPVPARDWMVVVFRRADRVRLVDAPAGVHDFQAPGLGFYASGAEAVRAQRFALELMGVLEREGWTVEASVNHEADGPDAWYCSRVKGWTHDLPVYSA